MPSTLVGEAVGGGGGGASSGFFFGMAYGPTLSVGPPASAGTSCLGLPLFCVLSCGGAWDWSWAEAGVMAESETNESANASIGLVKYLERDRGFVTIHLADM